MGMTSQQSGNIALHHTVYTCTLVSGTILTLIPRAQMSYEPIAHEAELQMGY